MTYYIIGQKVPKNARKVIKRAKYAEIFQKSKDFIVPMLLFAHAKRVGVSSMQDVFRRVKKLGRGHNLFFSFF